MDRLARSEVSSLCKVVFLPRLLPTGVMGTGVVLDCKALQGGGNGSHSQHPSAALTVYERGHYLKQSLLGGRS